MTSDRDILQAARLMLEWHGQRARFVVAQRAERFFEMGDLDGASAWRRILEMIEELERGRREGEAVN